MAALSGGTLTLVDKSQELPAKVRTYVHTVGVGVGVHVGQWGGVHLFGWE